MIAGGKGRSSNPDTGYRRYASSPRIPSGGRWQPRVLAAIRVGVAFTFALTGIGKAFSMPFMTSVFTQYGYPITFLRFILVAEIIAGVAIIVDWFFLAALIGLTIDMFGAITTHVHNGDPLDDSTGAINMLLRLATMPALWALSNRSNETEPKK
jgi:uncharacterized membrane protein YphA (DoxX/SURF4 family)